MKPELKVAYRSKFFHEEYPAEFTHFEFNLIKCENLPAKDVNGFSDPYVILEIGEEEVRSPVIKKTLNPVFNEKDRFFIAAPKCADKIQLHVRVMDWDLVSADDLCGQTDFKIDSNVEPGTEYTVDLGPEGGTFTFKVTRHNTIATSVGPIDAKIKEGMDNKAQKAEIFKYGNLVKKADMSNSWDKRFYTLKQKQLLFYKKKDDWMNDAKHEGQIFLEESHVDMEDVEGRPYCFNVVSRGRDNFLQARSANEREEWITAIRDAINGVNTYVKPLQNKKTSNLKK
jgi:hypothetical protein